MKLSDFLNSKITEDLGIDVKPAPSAGKFIVMVGGQKINIEMDISRYVDKVATQKIKQIGKEDAYVVSDRKDNFYNDLAAQLQQLQTHGGNIISKATISSTGQSGAPTIISKPLLSPEDEAGILVIDSQLEFILKPSGSGFELRPTSQRIELNKSVAKSIGINGTAEAIEIINSEEFWKVKNYLEANSSK